MTDSLVAATDQPVEFIAQLRETEIKFSRPDFEVTLAHFHEKRNQEKAHLGFVRSLFAASILQIEDTPLVQKQQKN